MWVFVVGVEVGFATVETHVGEAEGLRNVGRVLGYRGCAEGGGHCELVRTFRERRNGLIDQRGGRRRRCLRQQAELVTPESVHRYTWALQEPETVAEPLQQPVSRRVTEPIV